MLNRLLSAIVGLALLTAAAHADQVALASYLGVSAGQTTIQPNPPILTLVQSVPYGIGNACPGSFSSTPIQFNGGPQLPTGLGMHPPQSGFAQITFDLDAVRAATGLSILSFNALAGIDISGTNTSTGAVFRVQVDGTDAFTGTRLCLQPGLPVSVPLIGARTLTLITVVAGGYNSNHACWGNATLTLDPCPAVRIVNDPVSTCPGSNVTLTAAAEGLAPLTYLWRRNGQPLGNSNSASYTITAGTTAESGDYDCVVTNTSPGCTAAASATVSVVFTTPCGLADVAGQGGVLLPGGQPCSDHLLTADDIIVFLDAFFSGNLAVCDKASLGGAPVPDGLRTADDIIAFLAAFFAGCP